MSNQELGDRLAKLSEEHGEWSQKTFGADSKRGPLGPLMHLEKEAAEAQDAWKRYCLQLSRADAADGTGLGPFPPTTDALQSELADCLLLILDANRRAGFSVLDLVKAGQDKLAVNQKRRWPTGLSDAPVEHIQGE